MISVIGSNETLFVRLEIRSQIETSNLCTAISRSVLELVYAEVVKKLRQQEEECSRENCGCSTWNRYLLPCSHRIELAFRFLSQIFILAGGCILSSPRSTSRFTAYRC
ncbi:hypothetical protein V1522DRAFT_410121 [Lipomyces starkeyi]